MKAAAVVILVSLLVFNALIGSVVFWKWIVSLIH